MRWTRMTIGAPAAVLLLSVTVGCSGGGADAVTGGDSGDSTGLAAGFVSDVPAPGARSVGVAETGTTGNLVTVAVRVTDTDDVFSAGVDVVFDPQHVVFVGWSPGDLLETGGEGVVYSISSQADRVVVGASRVAPATGADAVGSRNLIQLTFRATSAGDSTLTLEDGALLDSQPPGPSEIPGVGWSGGTFVVQ